jgi:DNA-binding NtrC family response regulator
VKVRLADSGERAIALFCSEPFDVVFTDLRMPRGDGLEVLRAVKSRRPEVPVVLLTAYGTVETAVAAMKEGAEDFVLKPAAPEQVELVLKRVEEKASLIRENHVLKAQLEGGAAADSEIVGTSRRFLEAVSLAKRVARTNATVLVRGESGTGKELIAWLLHQESPRKTKPFIRVNCAALTETLLTSELFGHEKGSFTGATARREGRFELADGGTLFLDEIGEIAPAVQAKLLRVLETGEFERVGGVETLRTDVRVVGATNRDLEAAMRKGLFREDLYFRLNVVPVKLPPLRERREDIPALAERFLEKYAREYGSSARTLSTAASEALDAYPFPGNVRELRNLLQRAALLSTGDEVDVEHLGLPGTTEPGPVIAAGESIAEMERRLILATLEMTHGNRTEAARRLGVTARTLSNKLKIYKERAALPAFAGQP